MSAGLIFRRFFLALASLNNDGKIVMTNIPEEYRDLSLRELSDRLRYDALKKRIDRGAPEEHLENYHKEMKIIELRGLLP